MYPPPASINLALIAASSIALHEVAQRHKFKPQSGINTKISKNPGDTSVLMQDLTRWQPSRVKTWTFVFGLEVHSAGRRSRTGLWTMAARSVVPFRFHLNARAIRLKATTGLGESMRGFPLKQAAANKVSTSAGKCSYGGMGCSSPRSRHLRAVPRRRQGTPSEAPGSPPSAAGDADRHLRAVHPVSTG